MATKKMNKFLPLIVVGIVLIGVAAFAYYKANSDNAIKSYKIYGVEFKFRQDLRETQNVSVYPNEEAIFRKVWDPNIYTINIAYSPTAEPSEDNGILGVNGFEIRYKLDIAYQQFDWQNEFTRTELESYDQITPPNNNTLTIVLIRPSLSSRTAVEMEGNIIRIMGPTNKDMDLATVKFLMAALNITVKQ